MKVRQKLRNGSLAQSLLFIGVLVMLNLVISGLQVRLDFTEDKRYTLSSSTQDILSNLEQVVTVRVYFSEELPPELISFKQEVRELLTEYETAAGGELVYAFENPNKDEEAEQKAQREGISPVNVNVRRRDKMEQLRVYMGMTLRLGNKKEIIPFLQTGRSPEYSLTLAIKKLSLKEKKKIALLQGHGEPQLEQLKELLSSIEVLYDVTPFQLADSIPLSPTTYEAALWIAPTESIAPQALDKITRYLSQGGKAFIAYSLLKQDFSSQQPALVQQPDIGLSPWLRDIGIEQQEFAVIDARCGNIRVSQQVGGMYFNTQVQFPYFPIAEANKEHPITKDLEGIYMQASPPLRYAPKDSSLLGKAEPLLFTSPRSGLRALPAYIDTQEKWSESDFSLGSQWLAIALQGASLPHPDSRLVFLGDPSLLYSQQEDGNLRPEGVSLGSNAIDWICDDTGLIDLRGKGTQPRPLRPLEDDEKTLISYSNLLLPLFFVLVFAFIRRQMNLSRRRSWRLPMGH